ncbi:MAG: TAT-variant-translocated molybdopterin oxidoreductase [Planctomycetota bacterium]|nr:TAT-variant-translocated molybdopterin oxidoreductase [Planctomycetota bacterium]
MSRDTNILPILADVEVERDRAPEALSGRSYWRSLEHKLDLPEFRAFVNEKFPKSMQALLDGDGGVDRRRFLSLMAASLSLAGMTACRRPSIKIMPYAKKPEGVVVGMPTFYATSLPRVGGAFPVLVETHEGRPTKIEGNPLDEARGGSTDAWAQAAILELYDPDRSQVVRSDGLDATWADFDAAFDSRCRAHRDVKGRGLHSLSERDGSPAFDVLRSHLHATYPEAHWYTYSPIDHAQAAAGTATAFGSEAQPYYRLDRAARVVALDCDFLGLEDDAARHTRDFATARRGDVEPRLYAIESRFSLTGGMADHRLRLPSSRVVEAALALAKEVLSSSEDAPAGKSAASASSDASKLRDALAGVTASDAFDPRWIRECAVDLRTHAGRSLVVAGRNQPAIVHALTASINEALGNIGKTVEYKSPPSVAAAEDLKALVRAIDAGQVETLLILGGNPAYDAPVDFDFAGRIKRVGVSFRLGCWFDETSDVATWHAPAAHALESWGVGRTSNGMLAAGQPLIEPLFGGRELTAIAGRAVGYPNPEPATICRDAFQAAAPKGTDVEAAWRRFLHEGLHRPHDNAPVAPTVKWNNVAAAVEALRAAGPSQPLSLDNMELVFERDASVDDGRYANNGWLQELPDPVTKMTWDNAALIAPRTAEELGLRNGDIARLTLRGRSIDAPILIAPGHAERSVSLSMGYGRTVVGRVGRGAGVNAYALRTSVAPNVATGLTVAKTGKTYSPALTQDHFSMEGRDLVREIGLPASGLKAAVGTTSAELHKHVEPDIHAQPGLAGAQQWGMAIDLNTCVGCNACTVACQAENNIPIVGKDEVSRGREMHWIRIDRYFTGDEVDEPGMVHQPVACVHCEEAPCEAVCPANATVHNEEGLNLQVYNRCVGTRYCLNNCPYKVRRFNWFNYNERPLDALRLGPLAEKGSPETVKMQKNPDVTVRIRGVMEKCTYCVQRIEAARIGARVASGMTGDVHVPDGGVVPACAQACPAQAIVFGDIADPSSRVSKIKAQDSNYALLGELNTRPRTTYQARYRNPNPKMPAVAARDEATG